MMKTIKNITLLAAAFVAITFSSCKKDRTCSCVTSMVTSGTSYDYYYDSFSGTYYQTSIPISETQSSTKETVYEKIRKGRGTENCPTSSTSSENFDYTYSGPSNVIVGDIGKYTNTTTCKLK